MLALVELLQNIRPHPLLYIPFHVNIFIEVKHGRESLDYRPLMDVVNQYEISHQ
jgi:hypothetical protein